MAEIASCLMAIILVVTQFAVGAVGVLGFEGLGLRISEGQELFGVTLQDCRDFQIAHRSIAAGRLHAMISDNDRFTG